MEDENARLQASEQRLQFFVQSNTDELNLLRSLKESNGFELKKLRDSGQFSNVPRKSQSDWFYSWRPRSHWLRPLTNQLLLKSVISENSLNQRVVDKNEIIQQQANTIRSMQKQLESIQTGTVNDFNKHTSPITRENSLEYESCNSEQH